MKNLILIALILAAGLTAAVAGLCVWYLGRDEAGWTTRSSEALEEFEAGYEAWSKRYVFEARDHFERALELDPEFVAAKLYVARLSMHSPSERSRLMEELQQTDLEALKPGERFLVRFHLALDGGDLEEARELTRAYLDERPRELLGIRAECDLYWLEQRWDEAESCHRRLLRLHPNWVLAQNRLAYIAMARGRFDEAEEHLLTYRYIAPDQANPHDSLAELLSLRGRYEEAAAALVTALEIKPDFCIAHLREADIHSMVGDFDRARRALDRLGTLPACQELAELGDICAFRAFLTYQEGDYEGAWRRMASGCLERRERGYDLVAHRLALLTDRQAEARELDAVLAALVAELEATNKPVWAAHLKAIQAHVDGVGNLLAGNPGRAAESFQAADDLLTYWGAGYANIKLFNRLHLFRALEAAGRDAEAQALRREIEAVNPRLLTEFPLPDLDLPER